MLGITMDTHDDKMKKFTLIPYAHSTMHNYLNTAASTNSSWSQP